MKISCPLCDTSIEVSKFLVGQKGRCPRCSSKFLIPESPDDEMEILEKGEIPEDEPEPVAPPPPPKKAKPEPKPEKPIKTPPSAPPAAGAGKRRVMPATGAPSRTAARPVVVKQGSGAFGFLFAIVLAALVGVVVYVMMDKKVVEPEVADGDGDKEKVAEVEKEIPPVAPVAPVVPEVEPDPDGIPVFTKVVQPIFAAKCTSCHGEEKAKGRLRMHNYEKLLAGGGNGPVIEPDPDEPGRVELIYRAELPEGDEERMPPQGKTQLTADELAILKWWIDAGANEDIDSNEAPDEVRKKIQSLAKL